MGARVDEITVYRTIAIRDNVDRLKTQLEDNAIDVITFTSSSTVTNFKSLLPEGEFDNLIKGVTIASIGPITTDTAVNLGFKVHITAESYTIPGQCQAIVDHIAFKPEK